VIAAGLHVRRLRPPMGKTPSKFIRMQFRVDRIRIRT